MRLVQNWYKNSLYQLEATVATIRTRKRADGSCGYTAQIRIHDGKAVVHQEAKTFSRLAAAEKWAKAREVELEDPGTLLRAQEGELSLAALIRWYMESLSSIPSGNSMHLHCNRRCSLTIYDRAEQRALDLRRPEMT